MNNPYAPPSSKQTPKTSIVATVGTVVAALGMLAVLYGAAGFWIFNGLFPNGGASGRLPSIFVMGAGIVITLLGLGFKSVGAKSSSQMSTNSKQIPAILGIVAIVLVVVILFVVVANL